MSTYNYGLPPAKELECPNCKSLLQVWQRWVERAVQRPPPCPVCNEVFLKPDDGMRFDSMQNKHYVQHNRIEFTMIKLLRKGPMPEIPGAE